MQSLCSCSGEEKAHGLTVSPACLEPGEPRVISVSSPQIRVEMKRNVSCAGGAALMIDDNLAVELVSMERGASEPIRLAATGADWSGQAIDVEVPGGLDEGAYDVAIETPDGRRFVEPEALRVGSCGAQSDSGADVTGDGESVEPDDSSTALPTSSESVSELLSSDDHPTVRYFTDPDPASNNCANPIPVRPDGGLLIFNGDFSSYADTYEEVADKSCGVGTGGSTIWFRILLPRGKIATITAVGPAAVIHRLPTSCTDLHCLNSLTGVMVGIAVVDDTEDESGVLYAVSKFTEGGASRVELQFQVP